jgi:ABC-type bacteriocin/lantibiotic exporter with double-glycine peptidase domain
VTLSRLLLAALAGALLAGCATVPGGSGADGTRADALVRLAVPFFPDDSDQCGPSVLASVLTYWGRPESPANLRRELYRARLKGALTVDLLLAAQGRGFAAEMAEDGLGRIRAELDAGRPVIAFLDVGMTVLAVGHYIVITGYDDGGRRFFAHSGMSRDKAITYDKFEKQWKAAGQWALLIQPPLK